MDCIINKSKVLIKYSVWKTKLDYQIHSLSATQRHEEKSVVYCFFCRRYVIVFWSFFTILKSSADVPALLHFFDFLEYYVHGIKPFGNSLKGLNYRWLTQAIP